MESSTIEGFKLKDYIWDFIFYLYLRNNNPIPYLCSLCKSTSFSVNNPNYKSYNSNNNGMSNNILIARSRESTKIPAWHLETSKMINHDNVG